MKTINCWWPTKPLPGNVGDIITPFLLQTIFNIKCKFVPPSHPQPHLLGVGSILGRSRDTSVIWGSGAMRQTVVINPKTKVLTVRGPISKKIVEKCGNRVIYDVLCDPGLLAPYAYNPVVEKEYDYGIIPHYVDYEVAKKKFQNIDGVKIINVLNNDPRNVLREIMKCKQTISSSLHGIIFSNAYDIPCSWIKLSDKLLGDGTKFNDYFLSVGIENPICHDLRKTSDVLRLQTFTYNSINKYPRLDDFVEFSNEELHKL